MTEAVAAADRDGEDPPSEEAAAVRTGMGTFDSLRVRNFRLLLIGTTLANAAQWIQQVTLGWLVYDITGSGTALGSINLVRSIATVGLAPVSGVAIDRFPRRDLMLVINAWLLLASLALGLILISGEQAVVYLFVFTFLGGIAQAFDMPLRQTVVFVLVPRELASNAVALIQTGWGLMRSIGPAVGGVLIVLFGPGGNFLVMAAAYALIMLNTLRLRFPPEATARPARAPLWQNMKEGLQFVARQPTTRTFLLMGWVLPLLIVPIYIALPPIYAKTEFDGGPEVLGLLMSSVGIGGIFGGLVSASLGSVDRRGLVQLAALFLTSLSLIGFGLSSNLWLATALFGVSGFFEMIFLTSNQTLLQLSIPDALRGRVTSITTLSAGLSPLGGMIAGVGADLVGPRAMTLLLGALAAAVPVLVFLFVPLVREYRISRAIRGETVGPAAGGAH
jgi:MFS family permease